MRKLKYTFKNDVLFKMLFVQYPLLLKTLISVLLGLPLSAIEQFTILNPEMPPENLGDKFCRLDINMVVNGARVDLEIQVADEGDYRERTMFYWARDFSASLPAGKRYADLPRTVIISIIDFRLFDCEEYHSFFQLFETTRHTLLSDKMGLHFYELPKLPSDFCGKDDMLLWLSLFKATTEEELEKITASSEFRERERLFEKARHDEAQALYNAEMKGKTEIARELKNMGMPFDQIEQATKLSHAEIERL